MSFAEPMPSISTPIASYTDIRTDRRRRRHTIINRPDSAMGLLSEDEEEEEETFDRISGILSSLIQEANEAVHGQDRVLTTHNSRKIFTSSTIITKDSKIPRPNRKRSSITHVRNLSNSSSSSTTSSNLFSPISASSNSIISRSPSPINKKLRNTVLRPRSCPVAGSGRRSTIPMHKRNNSNKIDPITESFKRLDSSMALVDSLSRDLATQKQKNNNHNNHFTLLLLVPLLHIPHSLITMVFDFCTYPTSTNTTRSFSMSSMLFWACVFAVTNLMVDQVAVIPKHSSTIPTMKTRRLSLPGTYSTTTNTVKKSSQVPATRGQKQTWIPATRPKLCLNNLKRRNSI